MSSTQEAGEIFGEGKGPAQAMLRSPTVLIVSVGLWGMNILMFRLFGINYRYVLNYDLMMEEEAANRADEVARNNDGSINLRGGNVGAHTSSSNSFMGIDGDDDASEDDFYDEPPAPQERSGSAITWERLVIFSISLLVILHYTTHYWMDHLGQASIGAVFSFYGVVLIYIFLPFPSNRWMRKAFVIVLQRSFALINPRCSCVSPDTNGPRPIPFVDVFFADAMCSLSKVFFDWGMLFHMASHYPDPVPPSAHNILIPSACAAIPYIIRARQCLIMYTVGRIKNDGQRYQHIANAIKYSTSIFPLCLSAYQKTIDPKVAQAFEPFLVFLLTVNALYALYWDIVMDWGMMQNPSVVMHAACVGGIVEGQSSPRCHHGCLRPRLRFGLLMSSIIVISDTVLRFSWLLRFVTWFPNNDSFVLCTQFLEVFRRAIWNLLRVEWENIKQRSKLQKVRDSFSDRDDEESFPLVGPKMIQMTSAPKSSTIAIKDSFEKVKV